MHGGLHKTAAIVCWLSAALSTETFAQVSREQVQRWFDAELERAQVMPDLGDASIVWREDVWYVPPAAELNRLRAEVPGHPDHPRRYDLVEYERRVSGDPTVRRYQLWIRGDRQWRHCSNSQVFSADGKLSATPDYYVDSVITPRLVWRLSSDVLVTAPPGTEENEVNSIEEEWRSFWPQISLHLFGGLSDSKPIRCRASPVEWDGRSWRVRLSLFEDEERTKEFFAKEVRGTWDTDVHRGFAASMRIVRNSDKPDVVGREVTFQNWQRIEGVPGYAAFRVTQKTPDGRRDRESTIEEVKRNEPGTFERVTTAPSAAGSDAVRGPSTFIGIKDFGAKVIRMTANGEERPMPIQHSNKAVRMWQQGAGWVVAGVLIVTMVAVRVYRSRN